MAQTTTRIRHYRQKLLVRLAVFLVVLVTYVIDPAVLDFTAISPLERPLSAANLLWLMVMWSVLSHLNPRSKLTIGCMKQFEDHYIPVEGAPDEEGLRAFIRKQDRGALAVLLFWLTLNLGFGLLYLNGILSVSELVLLCALCYLCDLICVLYICPFQLIFMKNRCCITCRIFAWGAWMMCAPLMLVAHPYAQLMVWSSVVVLIYWEVRYRRYPQRFWDGTNQALRCSSCRETLCQYKLIAPKKEKRPT